MGYFDNLRCWVLAIGLMSASAPAFAESLHVRAEEWVAFASEREVDKVRICMVSLLTCRDAERLSPGFFVVRDSVYAEPRGIFVVNLEGKWGTDRKIFDLRGQSDFARALYVGIGALIGFAGTFFFRIVEAINARISNRTIQIDQLRYNLVRLMESVRNLLDANESNISLGLSPFGVWYLRGEIERARSTLTDFKLKQSDVDKAAKSIEDIISDLSARRHWWRCLLS